MFSIIRNTLENRRAALNRKAASEINPALYLQRQKQIRNGLIKEILGLAAVGALAFAYAFIWLAYEGWLVPASLFN